MHILLLFAGMKCTTIEERAISCEVLSNLMKYTELLYDYCQVYQSEVKKCFIDLFANTNDNELPDKVCDLKSNYKRMISSRLGLVQGVARERAIVMRMAHLQFWTGILMIIMKNEYVTAHIDYVNEIEEILGSLKECGYLSGNYDDGVRVTFHVDSLSIADRMEGHILYLFSLINSSKRMYDISNQTVMSGLDDIKCETSNKIGVYDNTKLKNRQLDGLDVQIGKEVGESVSNNESTDDGLENDISTKKMEEKVLKDHDSLDYDLKEWIKSTVCISFILFLVIIPGLCWHVGGMLSKNITNWNMQNEL